MRWTIRMSICFCIVALSGCYSTARHVANVRPDIVKPDEGIKTKYRLGKIILKKSPWANAVAKIQEGIRKLDNGDQSILEARIAAGDVDAYVSWLQSWDAQRYATGSRYYLDAKKSFLRVSAKERRQTAENIVVNRVARELGYWYGYGPYESEVKKNPGRTHAADTKLVYDAVEKSLKKNYPNVFSDDPSAVPLTVVVDWATEYKRRPVYGSILTYWFWPIMAEQESIYFVYVDDEMLAPTDSAAWNQFFSATKKYPRPPGIGSAVRTSVVWESLLLPTGFIPVPGDSDWPKTFCFMRLGKDSPVDDAKATLRGKECFKNLVFEPKTDGDVIAAAIMRAINRKTRAAKVSELLKERDAQ